MKLLLDENLPHDLRKLIPGHDVFTAAYMKWDGLQNGALLAQAAAAGFDAMLTLDSGIEFQQNLASLPCSVVIMEAKTNRIDDLRPLIPSLLLELSHLQPNTIVRVR